MHNSYSGLVGSKVVVVTITREDIEHGNTAPALALLNRLVESTEALASSNGTVSLLVRGYDDDARELHMIAEVRDFFKVLDEDFPYWFHVCTRLEHSLKLLFLLLVDMTPTRAANGEIGISVQFSHDDLNEFVNRHLEAMDSLHGKYGFSPEANERITALIVNYFQSLLDGGMYA